MRCADHDIAQVDAHAVSDTAIVGNLRFPLQHRPLDRHGTLDVDEKDAAFNTALHLAADAGHAEVAQVLVVKGANLDAKDISDMTPLQLAILSDREAVAKLLITSGADVNAADNLGITVLDEAVRRGNATLVEMLQEAGAKCGTTNYSC